MEAEPSSKRVKLSDTNAVTFCRDGYDTAVTLAEEMVPIIGHLSRKKRVDLTMYGESLICLSSNQIVRTYERAAAIHSLCQSATSAFSTMLPIMRSLLDTHISPAEHDIGRLIQIEASTTAEGLAAILANRISPHPISLPKPQDCVLYGFGRIGRVMCRLMCAEGGVPGMILRAIVVRPGKVN